MGKNNCQMYRRWGERAIRGARIGAAVLIRVYMEICNRQFGLMNDKSLRYRLPGFSALTLDSPATTMRWHEPMAAWTYGGNANCGWLL